MLNCMYQKLVPLFIKLLFYSPQSNHSYCNPHCILSFGATFFFHLHHTASVVFHYNLSFASGKIFSKSFYIKRTRCILISLVVFDRSSLLSYLQVSSAALTYGQNGQLPGRWKNVKKIIFEEIDVSYPRQF